MSADGNAFIDKETQNMLEAFVSEGMDSLDANEPIVEHLRNGNNEESVNAIFRVFHTLKGLSGFFELNIINNLAHTAETLLDIIRKKNLPQSENTITLIYELFDFLRTALEIVNKSFSDKELEEASSEYIKLIEDEIHLQKGEIAQASQIIEEKAPVDGINIDLDFTENNEGEPEFSLQDFITPDMLSQYLTNSYELLELCERNLFDLEKDPNNEELVRTTFQSIHSIKGNSGFMGFKQVEELSAELESILDNIRNKEIEIFPELITLLLSNLEIVKNRLDEIGGNNHEAPQAPIEKVEAPPQETVVVENKIIETIAAPIAEEPKSSAVKMEQIKAQVNIASAPKKDIRVETAKIDKLFAMVGELITIETMVSHNPDLEGFEFPNFAKATNMLNKITRELQEISLSIRMMPLESLFHKMKRLVRDVSIKIGKKVELAVSGQDTEMDKNVIDEIADPLVHILRNSIDHGIETPEERILAGKPEIGRVELSARYEGNEIIITIEDDGKGLDKDKILKNAQSKGIPKAFAEKLSDKEIWNLIFEPGLSTAEKVTDISGRGVGMDVVKKNIEKLRGKVDIFSKKGAGSRFTLRIPLTLAIMEAMIIRIGDERFAAPILAIKESIKIEASQINTTMDGLEMVKIRDEIIPVIRLHEYFDKTANSPNLEDGILIIVEMREKKACLFADEILGQQQAVVKGISDYIGKLPGVMGCMILGDGDVGLILDIEDIIELSEKDLSTD